jgi:ABC-2 type transport system permease protein
MFRALTLAARELRSYLADTGDLAFSLLLPIVIFALIYGAFGGQSQFHGTVSIVNKDGGPYSTFLVNRLKAIDNVDVRLLSAESAESQLNKSTLLFFAFIPADFSDNLSRGLTAGLQFRQRGNGGTEGQIIAGIVRGVVEQMNQESQVRAGVAAMLQGKNIAASDINAAVDNYIQKERESPLVKVEETPVGSNPDPVNQFLPGIVTMFVLFAVSMGAQTIVDERKNGTLERLLTTRLSRNELFFGKFLAGMFRGLVQTVILLALSYLVFRLFTPLSFLEVLVVALVFSAAASALGLLIAALSRSQDQATWISVVFTNVTVILAGTFFSIPAGSVFSVLKRLAPNTYVNEALAGIIRDGKSLSSFSGDVLVILCICIVALVLSRLLFRPVPGGGR